MVGGGGGELDDRGRHEVLAPRVRLPLAPVPVRVHDVHVLQVRRVLLRDPRLLLLRRPPPAGLLEYLLTPSCQAVRRPPSDLLEHFSGP